MKAILILDKMPKCCGDCDFYDYDDHTSCEYTGNKEISSLVPDKLSNCPLKPIPNREDIYEEMYLAYGLWKEEDYERMRDAVDKVLDEILGEEE